MIKLLNEYLGIDKIETILIAIILMGLTLMLKDNFAMLLNDILFSEFDSLINQVLN